MGKGGSRRKGSPRWAFTLFFFPTTSLPQKVRYGEERDLNNKDRGKLEELSIARREVLLVSEMRAFSYKMMDTHNTLLTWLRD